MMGALALPPAAVRQRAVLTAVAISARPDQLRPLLRQARVGGSLIRLDAVLVQPSLVEQGPVLLDTPRLTPAQLARVLVRLGQQGVVSREGLVVPVAALVDAADRVTSTLLASAPFSVAQVRVEELAAQARELARLRPEAVREAKPPLGLPAQFLDVFAALDGAARMDEVALACCRSRGRVHQVLADIRSVLGLPEGRMVRFRPDTLLVEIVAALAQGEARVPVEAPVETADALQVGGPPLPAESPSAMMTE